MRYDWIKEHQAMWPILLMCHVLNVSTSGFYDFRERVIGRLITGQVWALQNRPVG